MAKSIEDKNRFIQLRAKGLSFEKISEEIGVSKPVLIGWNSDFYNEIKQEQYLEYQNLLESYKLMRKQRLEKNCRLLKSMLDELDTRTDFRETDTEKLIKMIGIVEERVKAETDRETLEIAGNMPFILDAVEMPVD